MNAKLFTSNLALVLVFVVGAAYVMKVVGEDPRGGRTMVHVQLPIGGGLQERSSVSIRGVEVGRVQALSVHGQGVRATLSLDPGVRLPRASQVHVGSLSLAGEQYMDFRPDRPGGPYVKPGETVTTPVKTPVTIAQLMGHLVDLGDQVDPEDLGTIVDEMALALGDGAAGDIDATLQNARTVLDSMDASWAESKPLLDDSHDVLDLTADSATDMRPAVRDSRRLAEALKSSNDDLEDLLEKGPSAIADLSGFGKELTPRLRATLPNTERVLGTVYERIPALARIFPDLETGAAAATRAIYDGALHVLIDLSHLEKPCVTGKPTKPPTVGGWPTPYLYAYCQVTSDAMQRRGPARAPRPPGDTTAVAPKGVDLDQRADPIE